MKILHLSITDIKGGASIAAYRLHKSLQKNGVDSLMMVKKKYSNDTTIYCDNSKKRKLVNLVHSILNKIINSIIKNDSSAMISNGLFSGIDINYINNVIKPDVVNLHWINSNFVSIFDLKKIKAPIVWTLHDMWPITSVKHYAGEDKKYIFGYKKNNIQKIIFNLKIKEFNKKKNLTIITPSIWLTNCAKKSIIFKNRNIINIPNGIDDNKFIPKDKNEAKKILNLNINKKYILFGAVNAIKDDRKGSKYLTGCLQEFAKKHQNKNNFELLIFGSDKPKREINFGLKANYLGKIKNENILPIIYSAAEVFMAPSKEDNLPNTVLESIACGTPVVAFAIGGMPDMIKHKINGYLAEAFDEKDLLTGLEYILFNKYYEKLKEQSRLIFENNFTDKTLSNNYIHQYKILKRN